MAVDTTAAAPAASVLEALEGAAWRIPLSTRRLYRVLAAGVVAAILASSLAAAWVASRNADTIADARQTGLQVASSATEFRTRLAAADAQAASTLISGGLEDPDTRNSYVENLEGASQALATAALVATEDDRDDIESLATGLTEYSGLVETGRANSRQGFPVGATYLGQARSLASDDLVPTAGHLRRVGEQRVASAANSVGGPIGAIAVGVLVLALLALLASAAVVAGRSRRLTHPALLAATVAAVVALVVVTVGILAQSRELRAAATTDIDDYVAANDAALAVSTMRVDEISAVASHGSGAPLYDEVAESARTVTDQLTRDSSQGPLVEAVERYAAAVEAVRATDLDDGDNQAAAASTLGEDDQDEATSAEAFRAADAAATEAVDDALGRLSTRFDAASDAEIHPLVPIALGVIAAALAGAGTIARARRYR
ncbi:MAG: hypothetical protein ACRD2C_12890 [Acidimicrobiales bacterium]